LQKKTVWLGGGCATDRQRPRAAAGCPPEWCNRAGSRCNGQKRERDGGCALAKWREGAAKLHAIPKEGTAQNPSCSGHSSVSRPQPFKLASLSPGNGRPAPCAARGHSQQSGVKGRWPKLEQCAPLSLLCLLPRILPGLCSVGRWCVIASVCLRRAISPGRLSLFSSSRGCHAHQRSCGGIPAQFFERRHGRRRQFAPPGGFGGMGSMRGLK
jgi:hypothetical protein